MLTVGPRRSRLTYLESHLVRAALAAAFQAAVRHEQPNAIVVLHRLERSIPRMTRTPLCHRVHRAQVLLGLFVTGGGHLATVVEKLRSGDAREAA